MNFHVLTLFPEMIENGMNTSITGRAITKGLLTLEAVNILDYAFNKHQKVDYYTYGGGAGMLMQPGPVYDAYQHVLAQIAVRKEKKGTSAQAKKVRVLYMTPQGQPFKQLIAGIVRCDQVVFYAVTKYSSKYITAKQPGCRNYKY